MIQGWFSEGAVIRPMVRAWVNCPLAGAECAEAEFLADTGAASTALNPRDAMVGFQLGADQVRAAGTKAGTVPLPGVGGQAPYFETEAAVPFRHANGREIRFNGPFCVGLHAAGKEHFPSLLGWDVLRVSFDCAHGMVVLDQ